MQRTATLKMFVEHLRMVIRKKRVDHQLLGQQTVEGKLVHIPAPWEFVIQCPHRGQVPVSFTDFKGRGRDDLAASFRDAVWEQRYVRESITLRNYCGHLAAFFRFLDETKADVVSLEDVSRELLNSFIAWLGQQLRIQGQRAGTPWNLGSQIATYNSLKAVLKHLKRRYPDKARALTFPNNPFPNSDRIRTKRQAYSKAESARILSALNADLRRLHSGTSDHSELYILGVHLLILGLSTGRNLQCLIELERGCLTRHPTPGRMILTTSKRRGYSIHTSSFESSAESSEAEDSRDVAIPTSVAGHIEWLAEYTAHLVPHAAPQFSDRIFLRIPKQGPHQNIAGPLSVHSVYMALSSFVDHHNLKDDAGRRLALCVSRLRPTFGNELYARTGDLRTVQKALNHADLRTTIDHYLDLPVHAERNHALVVDGMVGWTRREVDGKVLIAADGTIPLQNVKDLLAGGYNTGVARCRNPFRDNESVCTKFFTCFRCQNMVVFEDDLWRLFSFYFRLLHDRVKISPHHWAQTYGPILKRIDTDIVPQFPSDVVARARDEARQNPHPMWKDPIP